MRRKETQRGLNALHLAERVKKAPRAGVNCYTRAIRLVGGGGRTSTLMEVSTMAQELSSVPRAESALVYTDHLPLSPQPVAAHYELTLGTSRQVVQTSHTYFSG